MTAYYNEHDPHAAAWLRNLISAGLIAPGDVDERDIRDIRPSELKRYVQCHFFAGIGVWSRALRGAGWSDDRPVWTGSCPCQPFSAAGRGAGVADERHLWPHWHHLIRECRPEVVFGEQVASKDGLGWFDLVHADLEGEGYAATAVDLCAAGVGAPHIRQRLYFAANDLRSTSMGLEHASGFGRNEWRPEPGERGAGSGRGLSGLADAHGRNPGAERQQHGWQHGQQPQDGRTGFMGHTDGPRRASRLPESVEREKGNAEIYDYGSHRLSGLSSGRSEFDGVDKHGQFSSVADAECLEWGTCCICGLREVQGTEGGGAAAELAGSGCNCGLADADSQRLFPGAQRGIHCREEGSRSRDEQSERLGDVGWVGDSLDGELSIQIGRQDRGNGNRSDRQDAERSTGRPCPTNGFWRDADWIFCRDGKWRPIESSAFEMAYGIAGDLGHGRTPCEDKIGFEARMSALRDSFSEETISEWAGGSWSVLEQEVLRSDLHGELDGRSNESRGCAEQPSPVSEDGRSGMRHLRAVGQSIGRSSYGRESDEQRSGEPSDTLRLMPREMSFSKLYDGRDKAELCVLQQGRSENGPLLHAYQQEETLRSSLGEEAQDRLRLDTDVGTCRRVASFPLVAGSEFKQGSGHPIWEGKSRAEIIKGYGNAVNLYQAQTFIEAYLDTEALDIDAVDDLCLEDILG